MTHPPPDTFCRFFGLAFLWTSIATSAFLALALRGFPRFAFGG